MTKKLKTQNSKLKATAKNLKLYALSFSFALYVLHFTLLSTQPVFALDSTQSAGFIRSKCDENPECKKLMQDIASKAAKLKQQVNRKLKDKAYIGKIKSISNTSITLSADSGAKMVSINQDTVFETKIKSKTKFSQKSLQEEDFIAVLGDTDEVGVLTARKIILLIPPDEPKSYLWGQVMTISNNLITIKDNSSKNIAASAKDPSGIKLNDFIILTGNKDKNDIFKAGFVYIIPQGGIIRPKKTATASAKVSTPSAVPKIKR